MTTCTAGGPLCGAASIALAMLGVGLVLAVVRLLRGPSAPDRVVALELVTLLVVGVIGVDAIVTGEASLLSGALVPGLISFLGTVAFARYLEKERQR